MAEMFKRYKYVLNVDSLEKVGISSGINWQVSETYYSCILPRFMFKTGIDLKCIYGSSFSLNIERYYVSSSVVDSIETIVIRDSYNTSYEFIEDSESSNVFYSEELQLTLEYIEDEETDTHAVFTSNDNSKTYYIVTSGRDFNSLPFKITSSDGDDVLITNSSGVITIANSNSETLTMKNDTVNKKRIFTRRTSNTVTEQTELTYNSSSKVTQIKYFEYANNSLSVVQEYVFDYVNESLLIIREVLSLNYVKQTMLNNLLSEVEEGTYSADPETSSFQYYIMNQRSISYNSNMKSIEIADINDNNYTVYFDDTRLINYVTSNDYRINYSKIENKLLRYQKNGNKISSTSEEAANNGSLIANGYFENGTTNYTVTGSVIISQPTTILDGLLTGRFCIMDLVTSISQTISVSGDSRDYYTFRMYYRLMYFTPLQSIQIIFKKRDGNTVTVVQGEIVFLLDQRDNLVNYTEIPLHCSSEFNEIEIFINGAMGFRITGLELVKEIGGISYTYNTNLQLIKQQQGSSVTYYNYNKDNRLMYKISSGSLMFSTTVYDTKNRPIENSSNYALNKVINYMDSNTVGTTTVTTGMIRGIDNTSSNPYKTFSSKEYSKGQLYRETTVDNQIFTCQYDNLRNKLSQKSMPSYTYKKYNYDSKNRVIKDELCYYDEESESEISYQKNEFNYVEGNLINEIKQESVVSYDIDYTGFLAPSVIKVASTPITLLTYEYTNDYLISKIKYGSPFGNNTQSNDSFTYENGLLASICYSTGTVSQTYYFTYDKYRRLEHVYLGTNLVKTINYDKDDQVSSIVTTDTTTNYLKDNENQIDYVSEVFDGKMLNTVYRGINKSRYCSIESFMDYVRNSNHYEVDDYMLTVFFSEPIGEVEEDTTIVKINNSMMGSYLTESGREMVIVPSTPDDSTITYLDKSSIKMDRGIQSVYVSNATKATTTMSYRISRDSSNGICVGGLFQFAFNPTAFGSTKIISVFGLTEEGELSGIEISLEIKDTPTIIGNYTGLYVNVNGVCLGNSNMKIVLNRGYLITFSIIPAVDSLSFKISLNDEIYDLGPTTEVIGTFLAHNLVVKFANGFTDMSNTQCYYIKSLFCYPNKALIDSSISELCNQYSQYVSSYYSGLSKAVNNVTYYEAVYDYSETDLFAGIDSSYSGITIIPLTDNYNSINKTVTNIVKPCSIKYYETVVNTPYDEFLFNNSTRSYSLSTYKVSLGYNFTLPLSSDFGIRMDFKLLEYTNNETIIFYIENATNDSDYFKIYLNSNHILSVKSSLSTSPVIEYGTISLNTNYTLTVGFIDSSQQKVRIYINGVLQNGEYSSSTKIDLTNMIVRIGNNGDSRIKALVGNLIFLPTFTTTGIELINTYNFPRIVNYYNDFGRIVMKEYGNTQKSNFYSQEIVNNKLTGRIKHEVIAGIDYEYTYDSDSRVSSIEKDSALYKTFNYDEYGNLTMAHCYYNNKSYVYNYNKRGNITSTSKGGINANYTYDTIWKDRLVSYNGNTIAYTNPNYPGCPTSYSGHTLEWRLGKLYYFDNIRFNYDRNGHRTSKIVENEEENEETNYFYSEGKLIGEKTNNTYKYYLYDENGLICATIINGVLYYYVRNQLGEIIGLLNNNTSEVSYYEYDAFGKTLNTLTGILLENKIRYKGYYYDDETGLYMMASRYYNPEWGRFISPDSIDYLDPESINGLNLYAYAGNNPVNNSCSFGGTRPNSNLNGNYAGGNFGGQSLNQSVTNQIVNWNNGGFQIPIWISSLLSGSDFGSSIAPAIRTIYQYIKYPGVRNLNKLYGLDYVPGNLNTVCSVIGYSLLGLNIGLSAWSNFTNDELTIKQQWIGFGVDTAYTVASFGVGVGVGALVSMIPVAGPFLTSFASVQVLHILLIGQIKNGGG